MTPELRGKLYAAMVALATLVSAALGYGFVDQRAQTTGVEAELAAQGTRLEEANVALAACLSSPDDSLGAEFRSGLRSLLPGFLVE